jgi:hypothetical protein
MILKPGVEAGAIDILLVCNLKYVTLCNLKSSLKGRGGIVQRKGKAILIDIASESVLIRGDSSGQYISKAEGM